MLKNYLLISEQMKSNTFIKLFTATVILTGTYIEILARPLEIKEQILFCQNNTSQIDRSYYNQSQKTIDLIKVNDILHNYSLKEVIKLKDTLSEIKEKLIYEYIKNLKIYEKRLARREIVHEEWLRLITDYALASYNLELLRHACELRIEND